jgi:hypothetical protein
VNRIFLINLLKIVFVVRQQPASNPLQIIEENLVQHRVLSRQVKPFRENGSTKKVELRGGAALPFSLERSMANDALYVEVILKYEWLQKNKAG